MAYSIVFNMNGGEPRQDIRATRGKWTKVEPAESGTLLPGRVFDGWVVTDHDRAGAKYSLDGGTTATALDSYPALVPAPADEPIKVLDLAADGDTVQLSARWRVTFGGLGPGCPALEVAPFTPICSKDDVAGSSPLTLNVPVPVFAPAVLPPECACFTFTQNASSVKVSMTQGNKTRASGSVDISIQSTGDCCGGAYTVTPTVTVDIPECVTQDFREGATLPVVKGENGSVIGSITYSFGMQNCKPFFTLSATPYQLPDCANNDFDVAEETVPIGPEGNGTIRYSYGVRNCQPYFNLSTTPYQPPTIVMPSFCLSSTSSKVKVQYQLGNTQYTDSEQTISLTAGDSTTDTGCKKYTLDGLTLDMSTFAFGDGGSVFKDTDGNLYVDGSHDDDETTWYGGGAGDREDDVDPTVNPFSRGPKMRGGDSPAGAGDYEIPHTEGNYRLMDVNGSTLVRWENATSGNLNMVFPTGFQWDARGIALNLFTLDWNPSGILSWAAEVGYAPILAPGIATSNSGANASGLQVIMNATSDNQGPGLAVNAGAGLRIFGADTKTDPSEVTTTTSPNLGMLEIDAHPDDFQFDSLGRLVLNDEEDTSQGTASFMMVPTLIQDGDAIYYTIGYPARPAEVTPTTFLRNGDAAITAVVADPTIGGNPITGVYPYWTQDDGSYLWRGKTSTVTGYITTSKGHTTTAAGKVTTLKNKCTLENGQPKKYNGDLDDIAEGVASLITLCDALTQGITALQNAVTNVNNAFGTLGVATINVARSGAIMSITPYTFPRNIDRHYVAPTT